MPSADLPPFHSIGFPLFWGRALPAMGAGAGFNQPSISYERTFYSVATRQLGNVPEMTEFKGNAYLMPSLLKA